MLLSCIDDVYLMYHTLSCVRKKKKVSTKNMQNTLIKALSEYGKDNRSRKVKKNYQQKNTENRSPKKKYKKNFQC